MTNYTMDNYGDGSRPENLVAIPSQDGPYFTQGKRYPIIGHEAWVYIVRCDRGHKRVISMESGIKSAHLPNGSDDCGTFTIQHGGIDRAKYPP